jgi:hypothetical protein
MGALQQKPRSQHLGPFLQHCMQRLQHMSREQLVSVLEAMAQLQLSRVDTQVRLLMWAECYRVAARLALVAEASGNGPSSCLRLTHT